MYAENKQDAIKVHSRLCEDSLIQYQKIYIREYVPLDILTEGFRGLPITREYRFFIFKNQILSCGFYWSSHFEELKELGYTFDPSEVPDNFIKSVIEQVQTTQSGPAPNFYVIDVAKTRAGEWIVVELNDGSMSGLSENDPEVMYGNLAKILKDENFRL
jgi:hypothetical protein